MLTYAEKEGGMTTCMFDDNETSARNIYCNRKATEHFQSNHFNTLLSHQLDVPETNKQLQLDTLCCAT